MNVWKLIGGIALIAVSTGVGADGNPVAEQADEGQLVQQTDVAYDVPPETKVAVSTVKRSAPAVDSGSPSAYTARVKRATRKAGPPSVLAKPTPTKTEAAPSISPAADAKPVASKPHGTAPPSRTHGVSQPPPRSTPPTPTQVVSQLPPPKSSPPAPVCPQPRQQPCCGSFGAEANALYWQACGQGQRLGLTGVSIPGVEEIDTYFNVSPRSDWGVRGALFYTDCTGCSFARVDYLYIETTDRSQAIDPERVSYLTTTGSAFELSLLDTSIRHEYQKLGGHVGRYFCQSCRGGVYGYGAVSWIYLEERDRMNGIEAAMPNTEVSLRQRMRYTAAAFEFGVGGRYKICGGFGLSGHLGAVGAIGDRTTNFTFTTLDTSGIQGGMLTNIVPSVTACVPGYNFKLQGFYEWCCRCWTLEVGIGYEHHQYYDVLFGNPLFLPTNFPAPTQASSVRDFGLGGMTLSAKVGY